MKLIKIFINEIIRWVYYIISVIPGGIGILTRRFVYKKFFLSVGNNLIINTNVEITGFKNISFGKNKNSYFLSRCKGNIKKVKFKSKQI